MTENEVGRIIVGAALCVHRTLVPGLLESVYEACFAHEPGKRRLHVERQKELPIVYDGVRIDGGFRLDLLVHKLVILEMKAAERLLPVHSAQVLTYLKLGGYRLGFLLNFNRALMKDGIRRVVLRL